MENNVEVQVEKEEEIKEDRLSNLPNEILENILSFLPINNAIASSILSRRWIRIWTKIDSLDLIIQNSYHDHYKQSISIKSDQDPAIFSTSHINHILHQLTSPCIRKLVFHLQNTSDMTTMCLHQYRRIYIESWLSRICDRNVQEVHIKVIKGHEVINSYINVPLCLLQMSSLVVLELVPTIHCNLPTYNYDNHKSDNNVFNLPNLKKLSICLSDECFDSFLSLLNSCPILDDLFIRIESRLYPPRSYIEIFSESLKRLAMVLPDYYSNIEEIAIDTPNLNTFQVINPFPMIVFVSKHISLLEAKIDCISDHYKQPQVDETTMEELFKEISSVKSLVLNKNCDDCGFEGFLNMTSLNWTIPSLKDFNKLLTLLTSCPVLESLSLQLHCEKSTRWGRTDSGSSPFLLSHAKKIQLIVDETMLYENLLRLVRCLLSGAKIVEQLIVDRTTISSIINPQYCSDECRKERQFCKQLYKKCTLGKSRCHILFLGRYFEAKVPDGEIVMLPPRKPKDIQSNSS